MKKPLSFLLITAMMLALIPFSAFSVFAVDATVTDEQGVTYFLNDGTYYIVWDCDESVTSVVIPATVNGLPVKEISEYAFEYCVNLTSVVITNGVTTIDWYAFAYCYSLISVNIPKTVIYIGDFAFEGCLSLKQINTEENNKQYSSLDGVLFDKNKTSLICYPAGKESSSYIIPDSVISIGDGAFGSCSSLTSVIIPAGVTSISDFTFYECSSLKTVDIPNYVTFIGYCAFSGCSSLTNITIPNSVTRIDDYAFESCSSLTSINIPKNITYIGNSVFRGCESLDEINAEENNKQYSSLDGVLFDKNKTSLICYPAGKESPSYIIPDSVTHIDDCAFAYCRNIKEMIIPKSVSWIGDSAFSRWGENQWIFFEISEPSSDWGYWRLGCEATIIWGDIVINESDSCKNIQVDITYVSDTPVVDGTVDFGEYGSVEPIHTYSESKAQFNEEFNEHSDWDFDFYMAWDEENLYMAWIVESDVHAGLPEEDFMNDGVFDEHDYAYMWQYSCIQFIITPGAPDGSPHYQTNAYAGNYLEAGMTLSDKNIPCGVIWSYPVGVNSSNRLEASFEIVRDEENNTTTYETYIPWKNCGLADITNGTQFGLAYAVASQEDFYKKMGMIEWQDAILGGKNADNAAVITLVDKQFDEDDAVMSYAEYLAADIGTEVTIDTYVQASQSWWNDSVNLYCQSKEGGVFVYNLVCSEEDYKKLILGTKIRVTGTKTEYAGEIEIADAIFEFIEGGDAYIAKPIDLTSKLDKDELINHMNEYVSFKGLTFETLEYKTGKPGDDIYVTFSKDGNFYEFCVEVYLKDSDSDVYKDVGNLKKGDMVDVEGFLYWFNGPNLHITNVIKAFLPESDLDIDLGIPNENPAFNAIIYAPKYCKPNEEFEVRVVIENVARDDLATVLLDLYYDAESLVLLNSTLEDEALDCIVSLPGVDWENISSEISDGIISLGVYSFSGETFAQNNGDIEFSLIFKAKENVKDKTYCYIPHNSIEGMSWSDLSNIYGNGSIVTINLHSHNYILEPNDSISHKYVCECGKEYTEAHDFAFEVIVPDCENSGYTVKTCKDCGEVVTTDFTNAIGHKAGEWVIVKEAEMGVDGLREKYCTVCGKLLESEVIKTYVKGDVNGNGEIDAQDYALAKRHCLKTYTLTDEMLMRADINGNGTLEASEYALIKRHVLGTYFIK